MGVAIGSFWHRTTQRPVNRITIAVALMWVLYLLAEEPWHSFHHTPFYGAPAEFFLRIGYHAAAAFGLNPRNLGGVQFCAGLLALISAVQVLFWAVAPQMSVSEAPGWHSNR